MAQKNIFNRAISNPVVQTFLIYVSGGWIVLEMTDYFINNYGLGETFRDVLLIIMLAGLPVSLFISWYLSRAKREKAEDLETTPDIKTPDLFTMMLRKPWFSIPGAIIMILIVLSLIRLVYRHSSDITGSIEQAHAEISLAVLPFTNLTGNADQEWLVAGQHETLITELSKMSQIRPLRMISSSTVNAFKKYDKPVPEIAREINVDFLVEASVFTNNDTITLQLRLIEVYPEENVVWAESCSSDISNIYKLHSTIADKIAEVLNLDLSPEEKENLLSPREVNPEAYKAYTRGMYYIRQSEPESTDKGLEYLHEAISIDPADPFAYAWLALGYLEIAHNPLNDFDDALAKAEAAANQALKLDSTLVEIYVAWANLYQYKFWDFVKAEQYYLKALKVDPNLADVHYHYAWTLFLFGRMEEAIAEHILAKKYNPLSHYHTAMLGWLYCFDGQYENALIEAAKSFELKKDNQFAYYVIGMTYLLMGKNDEAIEAHRKVVEAAPYWKWPLGYTYAVTGHIQEAEEILNEFLGEPRIGNYSAFQIAAICAALGRKDEAFEYLNREPHHSWTAWAAVLPEFESLHDDPRFEDFLERLNLPN